MVLGICVALLVGSAAATLHLYVQVIDRFDGRLWALPSLIYSDLLTLDEGDPASAEALAARLHRTGYARVDSAAGRPGQYSIDGQKMDVHVRPFRLSGVARDAARYELRFNRGALASIRGADGRRVAQAELEPELLATLFGDRHEERSVIRLENVPAPFIDAVLAAEDARFFDHHGFDARGILRAAWTNLRSGRIVQGGSTITQQTVKNLFLGQERTWWRKIREGAMAVLLDARYTKRRILEVYLNEVYLGQRGSVAICGIQAAARFYFGRDVEHLTLGESATLAGIIRSPGSNNPFRHAERAVARRNQVLQEMERRGSITAEQAAAAEAEPLELASGAGGYAASPHAVDFVRLQLEERFSGAILRTEGLRVYTTIDTRWQTAAEEALVRGLERIERDYPTVASQREERRLEGAALISDPSTGAILAMVGGRDYARSQFNRVVQARRQPGSCFKPIIFAVGFDREIQGEGGGLTPASLLDDSPLEMVSGGKIWRPENYDSDYRGMITVRRALEASLNVPAVRAATHVGLDNVIESAQRCGIRTPLKPVPSLALGSSEVSPLELATGYATLANGGVWIQPWVIREVADRNNRPLARHESIAEQAITPQSAYLVNEILQGVVQRGTARSAATLGYRGEAAGKTGTTDDTRDAWFVGYTEERLGLIWVGYDDNAKTGLTGATGALPIWTDMMRRAGASRGGRGFSKPAGLVRRTIDPATGQLATRSCPEWVGESFVAGTEPTRTCELHRRRMRRWLDRLLGKRRHDSGPGV